MSTELTDDSLPSGEPLYKIPLQKLPPTHDQSTRKLLAVLILVLLGLIYLGIYGFFLPGLMSIENMTAAVAGLSGLQALAAAAIGFYYGANRDEKQTK